MPAPRQFFRRTVQKAAIGGTFDDVEFAPPVEHSYTQITRAAFEDETNAPSSIRLVVVGHGDTYMLKEQDPGAAAVLYQDVDRTWITDGEKLVARFFGATAADVLKLYVEGWVHPLGPEPV